MKNTILLILSLLVSANLSAQRWSSGLSLAGGINGKNTTTTTDHYYSSGYWKSEASTSPQLNYATSIWVGYQLNKRLSLQLEAEYQFITSANTSDYKSYLPSLIPRRSVVSERAWQQYWVAFPLSVRYNLGLSNWNWQPFVIAGIRGEWLHQLKHHRHQTIIDQAGEVSASNSEQKIDIAVDYFPYKRWNLSPQIGLGLQVNRITLQVLYIGNFQTIDSTLIEELEYHYYHPSLELRPAITPISARMRMPGSLRMQFQYRLF